MEHKEHVASFILQKCEEYGPHIAQRVKRNDHWVETTYQEFGRHIRAMAKSIMEIKIEPGDRVGIFSENRPEWAVADLGILAVFGVSVPIYATNTASQVEYIVNDAGIKLLFVGDADQYAKVNEVRSRCKTLEKVILFESVATEMDCDETYADFMVQGNRSVLDDKIDANLASADPSDLATLIYTSGTTGEPKGVMLIHSSFFHQFRAIDRDFKVTSADRSLCFLPLSHSFERAWSYYVFVCGASNSYLDDARKVRDYFPDVKPTAMVSVPRLYEKIYGMVFAKLETASPLKRALFLWAVKTGKEFQYSRRKGHVGPLLHVKHSLADKLVLHKIRSAMGGPKNFLAAGGAALAKEIEEFFFAAGVMVCQGYGLSETAPVLTANVPHDFRFGTVGKPVLEVELKIAEDGEILARGPNLMKGYYNKPEATAEAIVDGWFHTGDIGVIDPDGFVRITDRKKDLIVTSGGKNVAPQHIETELGADHYIEQLVAIGDARHFISALLVPNFEALEGWASEQGISYANHEELVKNPKVYEHYQSRLDSGSANLARYEQVKKFTILPRSFSQETGELTPTMKVKRRKVGEKYRDIIEGMYK
jgi:long-chain acyl-CoA synthetase